MSDVDSSELKRIIAAVKSGKLSGPLVPSDSIRLPISKKRRAAANMAESFLGKAGLDLAKINKLIAEDQNAMRRAFDKQLAVAAKNSRKAHAAFRSGMVSRFEALKVLALPHVSTFVNLDKPFLIGQLPALQLDIFIGSKIESMNSSVDVLVNKSRGSNGTRFIFFFLWGNPSNSAAVVNVRSSLIVNGACVAQAHSGIFSGHRSLLDILASLILTRWSGWGNDPITGNSNNQTPHPDVKKTQFQQITFLDAKGGHIFEGADRKSRLFSFEQFPLSHDLLVVPAKAVTLFQVMMQVVYELDPGGNIEDIVRADFSTNGNTVVCPNLELEILTPLSTVVAG